MLSSATKFIEVNGVQLYRLGNQWIHERHAKKLKQAEERRNIANEWQHLDMLSCRAHVSVDKKLDYNYSHEGGCKKKKIIF